MKSVAFLMCSVPLVLAGQRWVATKGIEGSFTYLAPVALVSMAAAIFGYFFSPFAYTGYLFQGFVYGPNMMGSLLAISFPFILWQAWRYWDMSRRRTFWVAASLLNFGFIYMTQSRAALLVAVCALGGMCLSFSKRKAIAGGFFLALAVVLVMAVRPDLQTEIVQQVIYKHSDDIFYTRIQPWSESLEKARLGGVLGAGYGVSIGSGSWGGGLTAVGYGREKGNSQLAIIEETGFVGLTFYLLLVSSLVLKLYNAFTTARNPKAKVALGLASGAVVGMLMQSVFEAWWVAPGAPESVAFWALTGVSLGLCARKDDSGSIDVTSV
jgi:cell division protein FtsW (lipid II flippase)